MKFCFSPCQGSNPLADFPTGAKEEWMECRVKSAECRVNNAVLSVFAGRMKKIKGNLFSFPWCCVGYELFSRAVASQVFSPLQRLTSVFGMGTGGPTALKTLTNFTRTY